jgi:hypothetical protein
MSVINKFIHSFIYSHAYDMNEFTNIQSIAQTVLEQYSAATEHNVNQFKPKQLILNVYHFTSLYFRLSVY